MLDWLRLLLLLAFSSLAVAMIFKKAFSKQASLFKLWGVTASGGAVFLAVTYSLGWILLSHNIWVQTISSVLIAFSGESILCMAYLWIVHQKDGYS